MSFSYAKKSYFIHFSQGTINSTRTTLRSLCPHYGHSSTFPLELVSEGGQQVSVTSFKSGNTTKLFGFVTALNSELAVGIMDKIQIMHDTVASTRYDPVVIHSRLEDLDHIITSKMLAAEDEKSPSNTACPQEWSPALAQMQQKANLLQQAL